MYKRNKQKAFTLVELLVVIAIIGLLSTIILITTKGLKDRATITKTLVFNRQIENVLGANLVGRWSFDEGEGIIVHDSSGWGNDGTLINSPTWSTDTPFGKGYALSFDGTSRHIKINNSSELNISGNDPITIEAWIKRSEASLRCDIVYKNTSGYNFHNTGSETYNKLCFQAPNSDGIWKSAYSNPNAITDTNWHHVVVSYKRPTVNFYVDGVDWGSASRDFDMISTSEALLIGKMSSNYFNGLIDEVRIYSAALNSAQVQYQYYAGLDRLLAKELIDQEEYQDRLVFR